MDLSEVGVPGKRFAGRHPWEMARIDLLQRWLAGSELTGAVVDIGCGDGYVIGEVARLHPQCICIGVDSAYAGQVEPPPGVTLLSSLDELSPTLPPPSLVLLMDVLEHVEDPVALLRELVTRGVVDPATQVLVMVPAWQALFSSHDRQLRHFRRYRLSLLHAHLESAGLVVEQSGYFFLSLLLIRTITVALERLGFGSGHQITGLTRWRGGPGLGALLRWVLQADVRVCEAFRKILGLQLPGLSCYARCRLA